jgi:hypothetical protein
MSAHTSNLDKRSQQRRQFAAYGRAHLVWIEKDEPGEFRDANDYLQDCGYGSLKRTTGYYCDDDFNETAVPALYRTRAECVSCDWHVTDDCEKCGGSGDVYTYYAAVRDPNNAGCGVVDTDTAYSEDETADAARDAHGLAERYGESEREYQEKFSAHMLATERLPEEIAAARDRHSYLVRCIHVHGDASTDDATGARLRKEQRTAAAHAIKAIRELRDQYNDFKGFES